MTQPNGSPALAEGSRLLHPAVQELPARLRAAAPERPARRARTFPLASPPVTIPLGNRRTFPPTRLSVVGALASWDDDARGAAAGLRAGAYWGPVAGLLGFAWKMEGADAEDLTQDFFAEALEKEWFTRYDPARGKFRTFLRTCVDRFAANAAKAQGRLKRGGSSAQDPIEAADQEGAQAPDEMDTRVHAEWVRGVLSLALDAMRAETEAAGKSVQFALFHSYDVDDPPDHERLTYKALAVQFSIPESQVSNYLNWARNEFRRHVRDALRSLAGNDEEFREDSRELLGARPS